MSEETKTIETKVEKVEVNLDEIFNGAPGAESITLPEEESKNLTYLVEKKLICHLLIHQQKKLKKKKKKK